jgi:hypothetical protein
MMRRGRPLLRTAAVVGTATAVSGGVRRHQDQKYAAQDDAANQPQAAAQAPVAAAPAEPAEPDLNEQLTQLAQLHTQGILTDEEFSAKKAQLLGI